MRTVPPVPFVLSVAPTHPLSECVSHFLLNTQRFKHYASASLSHKHSVARFINRQKLVALHSDFLHLGYPKYHLNVRIPIVPHLNLHISEIVKFLFTCCFWGESSRRQIIKMLGNLLILEEHKALGTHTHRICVALVRWVEQDRCVQSCVLA